MSQTTMRTMDKSAYELVRASPFTRIHGKPTWTNKVTLVKEMATIAVQIDVTYDWAAGYGMLAEVMGATDYDTKYAPLVYIEPTRPGVTHTGIEPTMPGHLREQYTREHEESKSNFGLVTGFRRGTGDNIRDAIDEKYYEQLIEEIFAYKNVRPKQYIDHLENVWCSLDATAIRELRKEYVKPWNQEVHISAFGKALNREQTRLQAEGITINDTTKFEHYIAEMYDSGRFDKIDIIGW